MNEKYLIISPNVEHKSKQNIITHCYKEQTDRNQKGKGREIRQKIGEASTRTMYKGLMDKAKRRKE